MLMKDFGVTVICCTPSYFLHLIERAGEMGINMKELPLCIGVFRRGTVDGRHAGAHRGRQ